MTKQKIISIVVGLGLAVFLVIVGVKLVQSRIGRAAGETPTDFSCTGEGNEIVVTFTSSSDGPATVAYGTSVETLAFIADETTTPEPSSPGIYKHTISTVVPADTTHYFVVIGKDGTKHPDPETGSPWECVAQAVVETTSEEKVAEEPTATPTPEATIDPDARVEAAVALSRVKDWYEDNSGASFFKCVKAEELDGITGLVHYCARVWKELNDTVSK